jgi:hypothetical protein
MYGHGRLSQTLLEHNLLENRFAFHPVLLDGGRPHQDGRSRLKLLGATPLPSGVVALSD